MLSDGNWWIRLDFPKLDAQTYINLYRPSNDSRLKFLISEFSEVMDGSSIRDVEVAKLTSSMHID